ATNLAVTLNYNDRIGQMNNLVADARELVFNSRATYKHARNNFPQMMDLTDRLLLESREGADIVENGRRELTTLILQEVQTSSRDTNQSGSLGQNVTLPWAISKSAQVLDVKVGSIKEVESNVLAPYGNDDLLDLDTRSGYIDPTTHLYYGQKILKLP